MKTIGVVPPAVRGRRLILWIGLALIVIAGLAIAGRLATRFDPSRRARSAYESGDYRMALRAAQDYLKNRPQDRSAALMAARCLTRLKQGRQAEEFFRRCGPLGLDDMHDRAYGLVLLGQPERAAEIYYDMIQRWPENVLALKRLAAVLMELKQWKPALLLSERLIGIPEGEVAGHTLAGIGFHVAKHADQAVSSFERVLELDPELKQMPLPQPLYWDHLALDLMAIGRTSDARKYLQRALASREDAGLRELLGVTYEKEGAMDLAETCWRKAVADDPNNTNALLDLGRLALGRKRLDEGIALLERAAELSPSSLDPIYNLSRAYRLKGDVAKAEHYEALSGRLRTSRPKVGGMEQMPDDGPTTSEAFSGRESIR
jgi:tetratricopeptide (TPR) repeat protein